MSTDRPPLWERLDRPAAAPRQTLTLDRIGETAVRVADAEGLDAITMRRLATELGVAPMAPYRHIANKDELLEVMVDRVFAELTVPDQGSWRETLREHALRTRALIHTHPWLTELPPTVSPLSPHRMAAAERALSALAGLGLDADTMMAVYRSVDFYTHGATNSELAYARFMKRGEYDSPDAVRNALAPRMSYLMNTGRYPTYRRYLHEGARKDDTDWQFETGLDAVLDGIETRFNL
ncbi:TetR/AcrR family transcriptional regulator C-terminal domain-containing protein [Actinomadura rupiterrae]|uniref:TetR/AcrR family transcriptional regulator C-terminal domain-containing protein n=1 Tax=Actinomadura rupiterrae TaxID=559627 RepID=UPI0020A4F728|nr:TetR/AcrR family transcriptional regulator C-terminal domain-containing protein [Actinomadura rupiterrae]MCP2335464.1 AcrR family transcriptional regulator [Actinomadura rupiterrae]